MNRPWTLISHPGSARRLFGERGFKVCPVCDTLTTEDAEECHVCCWFGSFVMEPALVDLKLAELLRRCPELAGMMDVRLSSIERLRVAVGKLWLRLRLRLDISV